MYINLIDLLYLILYVLIVIALFYIILSFNMFHKLLKATYLLIDLNNTDIDLSIKNMSVVTKNCAMITENLNSISEETASVSNSICNSNVKAFFTLENLIKAVKVLMTITKNKTEQKD